MANQNRCNFSKTNGEQRKLFVNIYCNSVFFSLHQLGKTLKSMKNIAATSIEMRKLISGQHIENNRLDHLQIKLKIIFHQSYFLSRSPHKNTKPIFSGKHIEVMIGRLKNNETNLPQTISSSSSFKLPVVIFYFTASKTKLCIDTLKIRNQI